ncbi:hypothetical protein BC941DRAFT_465036 [Chlamydoabsidia padenii]|nr:hypothetical protein BC941DRAFT_465036 [Chlamydoabsidia padenii]
MSSVKAVIAALNQQNNTNDTRLSFNRQSKTDMTLLRNRFASVNEKPLQRSSHIETKSNTYNNNSTNRPYSSIASYKKPTTSTRSPPSTILEQDQSPLGNNSSIYILSREALVEQLEKVTTERDQLKRQLTPDTSSSSMDPNMEMPTLPPTFWFDMNDNDNEVDQSEEYEDAITDYHRQTSIQRHMNKLQEQLTACEKDSFWMMNKYVGELERERLLSRSLVTIIQTQDELITSLESTKSSSFAHQEQHNFLLCSQLELQRMELEDKQELLTMMADERDDLMEKVKQLTQPRTLSTCSTSSSIASCLDWPLTRPPRPCSPPQTPPPREKLPPTPGSTPSQSPRCTMDLSCCSDYKCQQQQLTHQNSMPDIRTMQHHYRRHGSTDMYSFGDKGIIRQKSFWKGWKQRLSN